MNSQNKATKEVIEAFDSSLLKFSINNPSIDIYIENENCKLFNCWNEKSFSFSFSKGENLRFLEDIYIYPETIAIFHRDSGIYEFIFAPLDKKFSRDFTLQYEGETFDLYYNQPSDDFVALIRKFEAITESDYTDVFINLYRYSTFYKFYKLTDEKVWYPTNFFIKGKFESSPKMDDRLRFFKHVNFYMSFFDKKSPVIVIREIKKQSDTEESATEKKEPFPNKIVGRKIDDVVLDLFAAARDTDSSRSKFIFYYQILEFYSYYYFDSELKKKVNRIIRNPDLIDCEKEYSQKIIEVIRDSMNKQKDESVKQEAMISDFCAIEDVESIIKRHINNYIQDVKFDGGYVFKKLADKEEALFAISDLIKMLAKRLEKIRNVLVHARENRENTVIAPTKKNARLLNPYVLLIQKIAETLAYRYE